MSDAVNIGKSLFFLGLVVLLLLTVIEFFRSLWINWGWTYPLASSIAVAVISVIAWWIFGGAIWLSNPKAFAERAAIKQEAVRMNIALSEMTNEQLRDATLKFVTRLRKFNSAFQTEDRRLSDQGDVKFREVFSSNDPDAAKRRDAIWQQNVQQSMARRSKFQASFKDNFLVDARLLEEELKKRVDPAALTGISEYGERPIAINDGMLAGVDAVGEAAGYLERLAKLLPQDE
jgi:hypothetical protein